MEQDRPSRPNVDADAPAILVVDDDEDSRRILMYGLGSAGYRVLLAENGAAALALCKVLLPSLVIMDLAMPEMDGFSAARELKADERTRNVPLVAWSARVFAGEAAELRNAGFDEVLAKPAVPADVIEVVRRLVPRSDATRAD
jgi:CheY-like chemotaxis protein